MLAAELLKQDEGYRRFPYRCTAGKLTVGYGRNLEERGISRDEADYLLQNDIDEAVSHLRHESYWLSLTEARQAVLINMVVNLGFAGFQKFRDMRAALKRGDYSVAADEMADSLWAKQVGDREVDLIRLMRSGHA